MQIDLSYKIKNEKGKPRKVRIPQLDEEANQETDNFGNPLFKDGEYFKVIDVLEEVCVNPIPKVNAQTGRGEEVPVDHKRVLFKIFHRIQAVKGSSVDLSSDEVTLLKPYISRRYNSPLLVGQVIKIIDPHDEDWSLEEKKEAKKGKDKDKTRQDSSGKSH